MQADEKISTIKSLLVKTTESLGRSFANYWPASDRRDPTERNLSMHFAHAMLSDGFSTFAEADHPNDSILGIDLFGLAPDNSWALACEFKCLYNIEKLESLGFDIERLSSFRMRTAYSPEIYGPMLASTVSGCKLTYGLVAGLHWIGNNRPSTLILDVWNNPERASSGSVYRNIVTRMQSAKAVLVKPLTVISFPRGRYDLLAAVFAIGEGVGPLA